MVVIVKPVGVAAHPSLGVDLESVTSGDMLSQARIALGIQRSLDNVEHRERHGVIPATSTVSTREALSWITVEGARMLRNEHCVVRLPSFEQVAADPELYARASRALHEILRTYAPVIEPRGYGHAFLDLTGTGRLFGPPVDVAMRVRREVRERLRAGSSTPALLMMPALILVGGFFVIPVVGIFVGFFVGLLLSETARQRDLRAALDSSWAGLKAAGLGIVVEFACALAASTVFVLGALVLFTTA